jgi:hypothetical protein
MKNETKKYKQVELMPLPHGGKREGAGRKPIAPENKKEKTVVIRVQERLLPEIEKLKNGTQETNAQKNDLTDAKKEIIEQINKLKNTRNLAEHLESKRRGEDFGQFEQILKIEGLLLELEEMINEL